MLIPKSKPTLRQDLISRIYYGIKPIIPRSTQIHIRKRSVLNKIKRTKHIWPIDPDAGRKPPNWVGWPEEKRFALVLTHDVETARGRDRCEELAAMEKNLGFRSSFNFLIKKYDTSPDLRRHLSENGFEVGIHGLYHDGKKFNSRKIFMERAAIINRYLKEWDAVGFRGPSMQCNLEWLRELDIKYDLSTYDTDPFELKSKGVGSIFPFRIPDEGGKKGYLELPYTLPQDFTLFILLGETTPDIWKRKLDWIANQGGMALVNTHPDYMNFNGPPNSIEEYPSTIYEEFLKYVRNHYDGQYYHAVPRELVNDLKI